MSESAPVPELHHDITPEEAAERAELRAALIEYHAHPGRYLLPVLDAGTWKLRLYEAPPAASSGYTYQPQKNWLEANDQGAAWDIYRLQKGRVSFPVPGTDPATGQPIWLLHPRVGQVADRRMTMAEYLESQGPVMAAPSPGSSAKAAELKDEDRERITEELRLKREREAEEERTKAERAVARALKKAAKEAEAERLRKAQGSMLSGEGA